MPEDRPQQTLANTQEFGDLDEEQKQEWLRQKALDEILTTEQLYVQDLVTLQQVFLEKAKDILAAVYRRDIFHSLEAVIGVAKMFLQELQSLPVHVAFMKVANFLKVYTSYCAGYNNSLVALTQSRKSSKEWDKYLKETENTQLTNFLSLSSYLIKPVQRICRYPLMLREILKYTPTSHAEYGSLAEALAQIENITEQVNEGKRIAENMQRIVEIHNSFTDKEKPDICNPSRILVREGELMKLSDGKLQTRHFFLFNDSLLYAKPTFLKKSEGLWVFCGQWSLDKIQIVDISSPPSPTISPSSLRSSGELVRPPELRSSGGSEIIRSDRLHGKMRTSAAELFGGLGVSKTTDDTSSSSPSLYLSSPPSSPTSFTSSTSSTPFSAPNSPALRGSLTNNTAAPQQRAAIPYISLTPPPSPTIAPFAQSRKHSNTDGDAAIAQKDSTGLRVMIAEKRKSSDLIDADKEKEKEKDKEGRGSPGPNRANLHVRTEHKRSLSDSAGDEKIPRLVQEGAQTQRSGTPPIDNEINKSSINLARTQSLEYQKIIASLPENAQHCFIVYAPQKGKPKRYILCAPDQRTKMLWLNDLLTQWRKASLLSQTRAARLVSQEIGDHLDSLEIKIEEKKGGEERKEEKKGGEERKEERKGGDERMEEKREEAKVERGKESAEIRVSEPKEKEKEKEKEKGK